MQRVSQDQAAASSFPSFSDLRGSSQPACTGPFEWQRGMTCNLKSDEEWWRVKTIFVTSIPSGYRPLAKGKNKPSHAHASPRGTQTCSAFIKQDWDSYHAGKLMQRMQQVQQAHSAQCPCRNTLSKKCLTTFPFPRNIYIYIIYVYIYIYIYIYKVNKCVNMFRRRCWQPQSTTFFWYLWL